MVEVWCLMVVIKTFRNELAENDWIHGYTINIFA